VAIRIHTTKKKRRITEKEKALLQIPCSVNTNTTETAPKGQAFGQNIHVEGCEDQN
jgi:hypothetical protein